MRGKLCSDYGISLMYLDSQITDAVLTQATKYNIPVLGVHDSFIVDFRRVRALKALMGLAALKFVGVDLPVKTTHPGADEITHPEARKHYMLSREVARSAGYTQRLAEHRAQYGPLPEVVFPG